MLKEHNRDAYEATKAMLLEHRECCLVAATGIGKSNITTELIQELGINALIIVPRRSIKDNWDSIPDEYDVPPMFSTVTYQFFCKHYKELYGFEAYIFDECHHAGATVWGKAIKEFRENLDTEFVLGLTADPNRYSDLDVKNRNVIDTVFNGHAVYGHDQKSAVEAGILPKASYICALYDTEGLFKSYANKEMTDELRGKFNYTVANCESIENIIHKHLPSNVPIKGIIFVDSIKNINIGVSLAKRCFPEENIYSIHSKKSNCKNIKMLDAFRHAKSGFIVSIDMLNEGLHIQGVNTIIMLRKTSSPAIYMQQIGRGSSIDSKNITIYDLVRNDSSIKKTIDRIHNEEERFSNKKNHKGKSNICIFSDQSIIKDYATDILTVLNEIDEYESERHRWTEEEDQIIRDYYPKLGTKIKEMLPGRSVQSIIRRANYRLNVYMIKSWSEEEDNIIIKYYPIMGIKVSELLTIKRSDTCIRSRAAYLNATNNCKKWSEEEDQIIIKYYSDIGLDIQKMLPGRTRNAIIARAIHLNIKRTKRWTEEEDQIIRDYYPKLGTKIKEMLPGRDTKAITLRANNLNVYVIDKKWTDEELLCLKNNYPSMGKKVSELLPDRTPTSCSVKARKLGLKASNKWTEKEDEILRQYYPLIGNKVAKLLPGRSKEACSNRAINKFNLSAVK